MANNCIQISVAFTDVLDLPIVFISFEDSFEFLLYYPDMFSASD